VRRIGKGTAAFLMAALVMMSSLLVAASSATSTLSAAADAFVLSTNLKGNRGAATSLKVRNDSKFSYIRFNVPALPPSTVVTAATLRMNATTGSKCSLGVEVLRAANDSWGETTITWSNQPGATGAAIASATWTAKGYRNFDVTSAVSGAGPVSFVIKHAAGCNVASDAGFSSREASTNQPQLVIETNAPPAPACSDTIDNDADGLIDFPNDPGCADASDTDETNAPPTPACSDTIDNDADGLIDFPNDPGCADASDTDETNAPPPAPACSDTIDNDADGLIDYPQDPGCTDGTDTTEINAVQPPAGAKVVAAAGDIVCEPTSSDFGGAKPGVCQHRATAALLTGADVVLPLGDLQYPNGSLGAFTTGYDPSWGQVAATTYPVVGNHEYSTPGAQGYFDYWNSKGRPTGVTGSGYYSFDVGSWHVVALNSQCSAVPCAEGSLQNDFLEQDLASTTKSCVVAYWHHPYFNSGAIHGTAMPAGVRAFWDDLYAAGADIILNGHEHNYQRYAKQTSAGQAVANGIREFVVGTGGKEHYGLLDVKDANYEIGNATDFGVLKLHLGDTSYTWEFVGVGGALLDAGGPVPCN
jgi:hypothetical protein